jgi:hypothetical protein
MSSPQPPEQSNGSHTRRERRKHNPGSRGEMGKRRKVMTVSEWLAGADEFLERLEGTCFSQTENLRQADLAEHAHVNATQKQAGQAPLGSFPKANAAAEHESLLQAPAAQAYEVPQQSGTWAGETLTEKWKPVGSFNSNGAGENCTKKATQVDTSDHKSAHQSALGARLFVEPSGVDEDAQRLPLPRQGRTLPPALDQSDGPVQLNDAEASSSGKPQVSVGRASCSGQGAEPAGWESHAASEKTHFETPAHKRLLGDRWTASGPAPQQILPDSYTTRQATVKRVEALISARTRLFAPVGGAHGRPVEIPYFETALDAVIGLNRIPTITHKRPTPILRDAIVRILEACTAPKDAAAVVGTLAISLNALDQLKVGLVSSKRGSMAIIRAFEAAVRPEVLCDIGLAIRLATAQSNFGCYCPRFWQLLPEYGPPEPNSRFVSVLLQHAGRLHAERHFPLVPVECAAFLLDKANCLASTFSGRELSNCYRGCGQLAAVMPQEHPEGLHMALDAAAPRLQYTEVEPIVASLARLKWDVTNVEVNALANAAAASIVPRQPLSVKLVWSLSKAFFVLGHPVKGRLLASMFNSLEQSTLQPFQSWRVVEALAYLDDGTWGGRRDELLRSMETKLRHSPPSLVQELLSALIIIFRHWPRAQVLLPPDILQSVALRGEMAFTAEALAGALRFVAAGRETLVEPSRSRLLGLVKEQLDLMQAPAVAVTLWSLGKLRPPLSAEFADRLVAALRRTLPDMSATLALQALSGLCRIKLPLERDERRMLADVVGVIVSNVQLSDMPKALAAIHGLSLHQEFLIEGEDGEMVECPAVAAVSYAVQQAAPALPKEKFMDLLFISASLVSWPADVFTLRQPTIKMLEDCAAAFAPDFDALEISMALWSLAVLRAPLSPTNHDALLASAAAQAPEMKAWAVQSTLWAIGKLSLVFDGDLRDGMLAAVARTVHKMYPDGVAKTLWALGRLNAPLEGEAYTALLTATAKTASDMQAGMLQAATFGLQELDVPETAAARVAVDDMLARKQAHVAQLATANDSAWGAQSGSLSHWQAALMERDGGEGADLGENIVAAAANWDSPEQQRISDLDAVGEAETSEEGGTSFDDGDASEEGFTEGCTESGDAVEHDGQERRRGLSLVGRAWQGTVHDYSKEADRAWAKSREAQVEEQSSSWEEENLDGVFAQPAEHWGKAKWHRMDVGTRDGSMIGNAAGNESGFVGEDINVAPTPAPVSTEAVAAWEGTLLNGTEGSLENDVDTIEGREKKIAVENQEQDGADLQQEEDVLKVWDVEGAADESQRTKSGWFDIS